MVLYITRERSANSLRVQPFSAASSFTLTRINPILDKKYNDDWQLYQPNKKDHLRSLKNLRAIN